jgi:hypothetical protein
MAYVEFVIPTNKDELLQGEPGQYSVTNACSLPELSDKLSGKSVYSMMYATQSSYLCFLCMKITGIFFFPSPFITHFSRSYENALKKMFSYGGTR